MSISSDNELKEKIMKMFVLHNCKLKASQIAKELNLTRREINEFLYNNTDKFEIDINYYWFPIQPISKPQTTKPTQSTSDCLGNRVLKKLQNVKNSKVFTKEYFESLADWSYCASPSKKPQGNFVTKTGNIIEYDSHSELLLLRYIEKNNLAKEIGAQKLRIKYETAFRVPDYFPDFVVHLQDGRIAIIEVKSVSNMSYHPTIEKYKALIEYCNERGYLYMMIDPQCKYLTFEEIKMMKVDGKLYDLFEKMKRLDYGKSMIFDNTDVDIWYEQFGKDNFKNKEDFRTQIWSMIIYYDWYNCKKHGFEVYQIPVKTVEREYYFD